ncbi:tetratricopeptide repeat protein [Gemmatimonadota bacterium]
MRSRIARREYHDAETEIEDYLRNQPEDAEAWELLGSARYGRWDFGGAAAAYRKALDLGRENAELLRGWVETKGRSSGNVSLVFSAGNLRRDLERALELDPQHVETRAFLAAFYYMVPKLLGGDKRKSAQLVSELIELNPPDGYYLLGVRAKEENEPALVVLNHWEKAAEFDPMHTLTLVAMGRYWLDQENFERALPLYKQAVESAPGDPRVLTSYGRALRSGGMREESAAQYRRALEIDPFWAEARFGLAEYFERIDDREAAKREYLRLSSNNPAYRSKEIRRRLQKFVP